MSVRVIISKKFLVRHQNRLTYQTDKSGVLERLVKTDFFRTFLLKKGARESIHDLISKSGCTFYIT